VTAAQHSGQRTWQRFSPTVRLGRFAVYLFSVAAIAWSLKTIEVIPEFLYDAPEQTADLFRRMWPFDWPFWGEAVRDALIETFHIATLGTVLALAMAIPLSFLAARNFTRHAGLNWLAQFIFVSSRSVNSWRHATSRAMLA
jgi:phosphonate transport system permease protein